MSKRIFVGGAVDVNSQPGYVNDPDRPTLESDANTLINLGQQLKNLAEAFKKKPAVIDPGVPPTDSSGSGISTKTILIGVGIAAAAYFILKK